MADEVIIYKDSDILEGEVTPETMEPKLQEESLLLKESLFEGFYEAVRPFGDLEKGHDYVLGTEGPTQVKRAYQHHIPKTMYQLELEDGTELRVSGSHLWYVETAEDLSFHQERIRKGEEAFKDLNPESLEMLKELAYDGPDSNVTMEIEIDNFLTCFPEKNREGFQDALIRVCDSVGPVAENFYTGEDVLSGELEAIGMVKGYDAKRVSQQILSLAEPFTYRKAYPIIKGRVVDTRELFDIWELDPGLELPVVEYKNPYLADGGEWTK